MRVLNKRLKFTRLVLDLKQEPLSPLKTITQWLASNNETNALTHLTEMCG